MTTLTNVVCVHGPGRAGHWNQLQAPLVVKLPWKLSSIGKAKRGSLDTIILQEDIVVIVITNVDSNMGKLK